MADASALGLSHVDHVGMTVPSLDDAVAFYVDVFGATEQFRLGPFDSRELPAMEDGRDWTEAHLGVRDARVDIAMLSIGPNLMLELFQCDRPDDGTRTPQSLSDFGQHHIAFKVENLDSALAYLDGNGCTVLAGPIVHDDGPCAGCRLQFVKDPWGNLIELMEYGDMPFVKNSPVSIYVP